VELVLDQGRLATAPATTAAAQWRVGRGDFGVRGGQRGQEGVERVVAQERRPTPCCCLLLLLVVAVVVVVMVVAVVVVARAVIIVHAQANEERRCR
jgi:Flp pilus assembly protein TadB